MSMTRPSNIFSACTIFHGQGRAGNHFTSVRSDDMHSKNLVRLLLDDELHRSFHILVRLRARVGEERELANLVPGAGLLELLLGLADPGDLWVRVDDRGNRVVVDVAVAGLDVFHGGDTYTRCE